MQSFKRSIGWIAFLLGIPSSVHAHVKWFVDANKISHDPNLAYHIGDPAVLTWISVLVMGLILAYVVDRIVPQPPAKLIQKGNAWQGRIIYIFQLIIGAALITTAYKGAILAPHLKEGAGLAMILRGFEALVGVLFIFNLWVKAGAVILFLLFFISAAIFGLLMSLEYFNLLGIALFLMFLKSDPSSWLGVRCSWALPLLRFHTGVALSVLAFSEKLLNPDLAMAFLAKHEVNFMKVFGFEGFSDHLFVLSAGFCELLFGLIFITGLVTRINTVSIAFFLVASNLYFFFVGKWAEGILEIIGHGNLIAIAMILVFYGAGQHIRIKAASWRSTAKPDSLYDGEEGDIVKVRLDACEPWCSNQEAMTAK